MQNSSICLFDPNDEISTVEEFLKSYQLSKAFLKKEIPKNYLQKKVRHKDRLDFSLNVFNVGMIHPLYNGKEIRVLHEDDNFLVISKPEKVHCHPLTYLESNNCLSFLRSRGYGEVLKVNKDHYDRGLLFRLDFETSGVLFFTKKESIYEQVRGDFQQVMKEKFYLAIVSNEIEESGTLINVISTKGKTVKEDEKGVTAEISFEKIGSNDKYSLIKIKLGHGHRHQIRAQLKLNGTPILGDTLYGGEESERVWLHALSYEMIINDDEVIKVSDPPELFFSFRNLNSDL